MYEKIQQEGKAIARLCEAADVSRAGYYRFITPVGELDLDMDLLDAIQKKALEWTSLRLSADNG